VAIRGQLQLTGALITEIEVKTMDAHHDHITICLESDMFVAILGTNRIRLLFSGCKRPCAEMVFEQGKSILHGVYIREDLPERSDYTAYCIQTSVTAGCLNVDAQKMQVELDKATHIYH